MLWMIQSAHANKLLLEKEENCFCVLGSENSDYLVLYTLELDTVILDWMIITKIFDLQTNKLKYEYKKKAYIYEDFETFEEVLKNKAFYIHNNCINFILS